MSGVMMLIIGYFAGMVIQLILSTLFMTGGRADLESEHAACAMALHNLIKTDPGDMTAVMTVQRRARRVLNVLQESEGVNNE